MIISKKKLEHLIESIINEIEVYDKDKYYIRSYILKQLEGAPQPLIDYAKSLKSVQCFDTEGNEYRCIKIPQIIYVYITGNYKSL